MSVVLVILKVIGISIGVILGLLFLVGVSVLLVPIRYQAELRKDTETFVYGFTFSWLCHLLTVKKKRNEKEIIIRIAGVPFRGRERKKKKAKRQKNVKKANPEEQKKSVSLEKAVRKEKPQSKNKREKSKKKNHSPKKSSKKHFSFASLSSIIKEIRDVGNRNACKILWGELWQFICYLSPQKVRLEMQIGTGDPCNTGLLFGGISLIPWVYAEGIHIVPDFEEKTLFLDGKIKGRVRVMYLVRLALRLYRNQDLKRFYQHITKKEAA